MRGRDYPSILPSTGFDLTGPNLYASHHPLQSSGDMTYPGAGSRAREVLLNLYSRRVPPDFAPADGNAESPWSFPSLPRPSLRFKNSFKALRADAQQPPSPRASWRYPTLARWPGRAARTYPSRAQPGREAGGGRPKSRRRTTHVSRMSNRM